MIFTLHTLTDPPVKVQDAGISFPTAKALRGRVELLPKVPDWKVKRISISGYPTHKPMFLFYRNSLDCVEYLLGNPLFANCMDFCPVRSYQDAEHTIRVYTEWLTGNAAWEMQVRSLYIFLRPILIGSTVTSPRRRDPPWRHPLIGQDKYLRDDRRSSCPPCPPQPCEHPHGCSHEVLQPCLYPNCTFTLPQVLGQG